jgi:esterase/lipase superfamily enzyme
MLFRRPDLFDGVIAMSGFYDLGPDYLHGYGDDNTYFNNPASYLPGMEGHFLHLLQTACKIHILTGQGDYEAPDASRSLSWTLHTKGIPHFLDMWGHDVSHDWPWWRKMLPYAIDQMGW